ncbi:3-hydroxyacyl-CoA dehydrogenase/enoyl-CoA hydratase family protein [Desulfocicer niacini]
MQTGKKIYPSHMNPQLITPSFPLPDEMAVIGAGTIGPDIGYYLKNALPDRKLYVIDVAEAPLEKAKKRLAGYASKAVDRKKITPEQAEAVLENIIFSTDYQLIKNCRIVIEAATENLDLKRKIFQQLEEIVSPDAFLTSNTSSIPADRIFTNMKHPERCTVTHFFAPAWRSPAVEVINWPKASQETIDYLFWFFGQTGKAPAITDNVISFMFNRIFENWCNEAGHLLDVATAAQINTVAEEFVHAGPFFVLNMGNGNPLIHEANTRKMEEGECYRPAAIFRSVEKWAVGRPGTKTDIAVEQKANVRDRMLGLLFSQSVDIADRGIGTMQDLNFGCQIALGFKAGSFDIMRSLGEKEVARIMAAYEKSRPGFPTAKNPLSAYQEFYRFLLIDEIDGVKIITIRRPQAMNALNTEIIEELNTAVKKFAEDASVKGIILTGYGQNAFSAGMDIGSFPETLGNHDEAVKLAQIPSELLSVIETCPKPVVAAVNGMALGGGLELAIRCHSLVAMERAVFQFPEITLGILPGMGGCVIPYRRWPAGASLFNEMICSAQRATSAQLLEVGMISKIENNFPDLIKTALAEVNRLQGNIPKTEQGPISIPKIAVSDSPAAGKLLLSPEAVTIAAETISNAAAADSLTKAMDINFQGAGKISCTAAATEGIRAFQERRKPNFK